MQQTSKKNRMAGSFLKTWPETNAIGNAAQSCFSASSEPCRFLLCNRLGDRCLFLYGGVPQMVVPTKMIVLVCFWGYHHLRKHPYIQCYNSFFTASDDSSCFNLFLIYCSDDAWLTTLRQRVKQWKCSKPEVRLR